MSRRNVGDEIVEGLKDALAYLQGDRSRARVIASSRVDASVVREKTGLSRSEFARAFGVSVRTLQDWEQGRRRPEGPARTLLTVIDRRPDAVLEALGVLPAKRPKRRVAARKSLKPRLRGGEGDG